MRLTRRVCLRYRKYYFLRMSGARAAGVRFDFGDLKGVAIGVGAENDQPLAAIEIAEDDVREEVAAKIGVGPGGECAGSGTGFAEFVDQFGGTGPAASGDGSFACLELRVPGFGQSQGQGIFGGCGFLFGPWRGRQRLLNLLPDEVFEYDEMFEDFGDRPAVRRFAEAPLVRGQVADQFEQARFACGESFEDDLTF